jgi:hypothetical protein
MKRKLMIGIIVILAALVIDRIYFMTDRVSGTWMYQRGDYLGDPIGLHQDFEVEGSLVTFHSGKKYFLVGCYSNQLVLYGLNSHRLTLYDYDR